MNNTRITNVNDVSGVFLESFQELVTQLVIWLPNIIIAIVIWWIGKFLLNMGAGWIRKIDIPGTEIDNKLINKFTDIFLVLGKFILALIILDYLGIGRTIIAALANGLTLSVALILGISFGLALKPKAEELIMSAEKFIGKKKK